jgi:hypothetical protein
MTTDRNITRRTFLESGCGAACMAAAGVCLTATDSEAASLKHRNSLGAYCGLYCGACPQYLEKKCKGCKHSSKKTKCEIRKCARKKKIDSCAQCKQYPCDVKKVQEIAAGQGKKPFYKLRTKNFETIQKEGYKAWDDQQKKRWNCSKCKQAFSFTDESCPKCHKDVYSAVDEVAEYQAKG